MGEAHYHMNSTLCERGYVVVKKFPYIIMTLRVMLHIIILMFTFCLLIIDVALKITIIFMIYYY
jgi:uncharacterized membrane protein YGL010W